MRRMAVALLALAVAALFPAVASAGFKSKSFKTPGGAVQCVLTAEDHSRASVLCIARLRPGVPSFPILRCDAGDPGLGLALSARGRATGICLSENPIAPPVRLFRYGHTIRHGGISCRVVSKRVGVRCVNAVGHGFTMSPFGWRRF